jgi:hypothetical protein
MALSLGALIAATAHAQDLSGATMSVSAPDSGAMMVTASFQNAVSSYEGSTTVDGSQLIELNVDQTTTQTLGNGGTISAPAPAPSTLETGASINVYNPTSSTAPVTLSYNLSSQAATVSETDLASSNSSAPVTAASPLLVYSDAVAGTDSGTSESEIIIIPNIPHSPEPSVTALLFLGAIFLLVGALPHIAARRIRPQF